MPASVATNGCTSKCSIITPMIRPSAGPTRMTVTIATGVGQPSCNVLARITVDSATTDPTLRSMPPVRITNVIPTASTMR